MMQPDLFAVAPPLTCGHCVHRNSQNETIESGGCPIHMTNRHRDDPGCDWWFGLSQLRAALYGRAA